MALKKENRSCICLGVEKALVAVPGHVIPRAVGGVGEFSGVWGLWVLGRARDWILTDNKGVRISVGAEASPDPMAFA